MAPFILLAAPIVVSYLTTFVKKLALVDSSAYRVLVVRALVAVFAYLAVLGTAWLNNTPVDPTSTETAVNAVLTFLASTGMFFFVKK